MNVRLGAGPISKWIAGGVVVVALGALGVLLLRPSGKQTPPAAATATAKRGDVTTTVSASGTVAAVNSRTLSFGASGTVASVKVKAGDTVKAGQVLAKLDTGDLADAVNAAEDGVDSAEDALTRAEDAADAQAAAATQTQAQVQTAALVQTGQTQPSASASPSASPAPSAAPSPSARPTGGSTGGGGNTGGSGNTGGGGTTGGGGNTGGSSSGGSDGVLSATQRLNNAKLTLSEAERSLAGATLKAPVAGKILSLSGSVGSRVSSGSGFMVLGGLTDVAVTSSFTEADIASLKLSQTATITIADGDTQEYAGTVTQIDPVGSVSGRLVKYGATITFTDPPPNVLLGQTVNVIVTTEAAAGVIYVPSAAVTGVHNSTGTVTVHTSTGVASRSVEIGLRGDLYTEIRSGLAEGDVVVLTR